MKYISRYPGVKPFETEEQHIFFGRSADIQSLGGLVGLEKSVLLYSKSGLGKTSLINAGLIPKLREDKNIGYDPVKIRFGVYSPDDKRILGNDLSQSPKEKIIDILRNNASDSLLFEFPELYENTLSFWIKSIQIKNPGLTSFLIFDQFEELFTYPDDQILELKQELHELLYVKTSSHFRDNLLYVKETKPDAFSEDQLNRLTSALNLRMLFVIRSDYLSMLNRLTDYLPNLQRTFYELKPLGVEEAKEAIIKPAEIDGEFRSHKFEYTKDAVDNIIAALSGGGKQPIETFQLQLVCQYAEIHIIKNPQITVICETDLGDIKTIHQSFYNNLMDELQTENEEEKRRVHILLEEKFIYEPEKLRLPVLKGMILKEMKISEQTLTALERTHLIRSEPYQKSFTYELSHDTLVEPILLSYYKRREEEEKNLDDARKEAEREEAEAKRLEKEIKEKAIIEERYKREAILYKARRQRNIIITISVITILSIGFAIFVIFLWWTADNARQEVEKEKIKVENANHALIKAETERNGVEVKKLINDARSYELFGYIKDARKSVEKALKIDSLDKEAMDLLQHYRNR